MFLLIYSCSEITNYTSSGESDSKYAAQNTPKMERKKIVPNPESIEKIILNMEKHIVGKRSVIELSLITLLSGGHLLLEDVPGVGKTTLGKTLAKSIQGKFSRIQFTPDTMPSDVIGTTIYNAQTGGFQYCPGAVMNDVVLADEINRTSPKTQSSLLEAMEEHQVTIDGKTYQLPESFMVIATQNPIDHIGTYRLPEAQLDRFMMKVSMGYPENPKDEANIVEKMLDNASLELEPVIEKAELAVIKTEIAGVKIHEDIIAYAVEIVRNTRKNEHLLLGASPRSALALARASRSRAYMKGRSYVIPEDVAAMSEPVLLHRLILSQDAQMNEKTELDALNEAMKSAKVPVL